jgi:hypothetical protein
VAAAAQVTAQIIHKMAENQHLEEELQWDLQQLEADEEELIHQQVHLLPLLAEAVAVDPDGTEVRKHFMQDLLEQLDKGILGELEFTIMELLQEHIMVVVVVVAQVV